MFIYFLNCLQRPPFNKDHLFIKTTYLQRPIIYKDQLFTNKQNLFTKKHLFIKTPFSKDHLSTHIIFYIILYGWCFSLYCYALSTDVTYQWYKGDIHNFIRPELNQYFFISLNGHLYLSEVQDTDRGDYFCVVTLIPRVGERLTTLQSTSRTSKAIELRVDGTREYINLTYKVIG